MTTLITIDSITDGNVEGEGSFDKLMKSAQAHIMLEMNAGRIIGTDYANVYLGTLQAAMAQSVQFELSKAQAGFSADLTQEQVQTQVEQTKGVIKSTAYTEAQTKVLLEQGGFR